MDRPFKPKYGTVSQVLLQLVLASLRYRNRTGIALSSACVFRIGARAIRFCVNMTLVRKLIDVTAILILHFPLYSQVEGGRLDRKYGGLHNRRYFFAFFRPAKASAKRAMEERQTRASSPSSITISIMLVIT